MAAAAAMALPKIERAHQMYREGRHLEALDFYTEALSIAKTKSQKIALHSNRAACHLKLHDFRKAAEECTSVLELDHQHTGALMLRAQTLVTLKEYQSALFDVNRLMELNPSSEVYKSLQARLKSQLSLTPIPESEEEEEEEEFDNKTEKQCVEVHLPDKFSESFPTGVECAVSKNEAECTEEVPSQNVTNTLDGTTSLHVQETSRQNKNNESSTIIKEVAVAWRLDADTYATVNPKEQKASSTFFKEATVLSTLDANKNSMVYSNEQKASPTIVEEATATVACRLEASRNATINSKEQKAIPQPKGHSRWDYSRWDQVDSDSSEDDDGSDEEEEQPRYRFRVKTFGACPVK